MKTLGVMALCACVIATSSGAAAQGRFELLDGDSIAAVQGLNVYTVRDRRTAVCYTLFVLGSVNAAWSNNSVPPPVLTSEELAKIRVAQTLREAATLRDRKIAELRSRPHAGWPGQDEAAQERINDEYASVARSVLPDVYPPGRLAPAWRSTTQEELDDAVRRAIADGDAVTAATARSTSEGQLLQLLNQISQSARLAVAGPVACAPPTGAAK